MNAKLIGCLIAVLLIAPVAVAQETLTAVDVRQGIPTDAHLAIYGKDNPERAYQKEHLAEVWQTFQDEKIAERFFSIITSRVSEEELNQARSVWDQIHTALEPIRLETLSNAEEGVYAQVMEGVFNQHLVIVRLTTTDAADVQRGFEQMLDLFQQWSEGEVARISEQTGDASITVLDLPAEVPFRPTLVRMGDVVIFSSSQELANESWKLLNDPDATSKFDDPRITETLAELPEAEDAVIFFDGRLLFEKLHGIPDFIRQQKPGDNEELERWTGIIDRIIDELAILDFELAVEYTEGQQNRLATVGKLLPDVEDKLLYQAVTQGESFENWQTWIPADAEAYSLNTGINLHVVYKRVMEFIREEFPESHQALDQFEAKQQEIDFHLDRDIFQSFSGECVSVTVPIEADDGSTSQRGVTALRCHDANRIEELLKRGVEALTALPPVQAQQLELVECEELEGFHEVKATMLAMFKARPVIGFHEGWMIVSSSPEAAAKVIATREGKSPAIEQAESFRRFGLEVSGPVQAISYTDVGAAVRQTADTIEQIGAIAPMFIGMMAVEADPDDLKPVQEIVGLLPSVAKVVRKFDFMEQQLTVVREGTKPDTYRKDGVWLIREAGAEATE